MADLGKDLNEQATDKEMLKIAKGEGRRDSRRNRRRGKSKPEDVTSNTSTTSTHAVFPMDSASMQAFGNVITSPGQENFIENFNQVSKGAGITDVPVNLTASRYSKRTANAMCIDILPYFGDTNTLGRWMSPLDTAALNLKQYIDTSFGTNTNYDPQDLMVYLMAVSSIFPLIAEIKRDLRLALTYQQNQYPQFVPQGLFALLEIHDNAQPPASLHGEGALHVAKNLRSFIDELNQMIMSFNRLPMPPEIIHFGYNDDLFEHIYCDSPDVQTAQLYVFRNSGYWMYSEENPSARGAMLYNMPMAQHSIEYKLTALSSALKRITALRTNSTAMLQNLFNAYGSRDTVQVPVLDIGAIPPMDFVYDPNICTMIENMLICDTADTKFSDIVASARTNSVEAHVWLEPNSGNMPAQYFNLPLQFHKPYESITREDIGWALRLHPAFLTQKKFSAFVNGTEATYSHVTCDGYTGFAFCTGVTVAAINDSTDIEITGFTSRNCDSPFQLAILGDFAYAPILVSFTAQERNDNWYYQLLYYAARRDVEVTYRLEDMQMHWTYMTQYLWASNVNRNAVGSRTRS